MEEQTAINDDSHCFRLFLQLNIVEDNDYVSFPAPKHAHPAVRLQTILCAIKKP